MPLCDFYFINKVTKKVFCYKIQGFLLPAYHYFALVIKYQKYKWIKCRKNRFAIVGKQNIDNYHQSRVALNHKTCNAHKLSCPLQIQSYSLWQVRLFLFLSVCSVSLTSLFVSVSVCSVSLTSLFVSASACFFFCFYLFC